MILETFGRNKKGGALTFKKKFVTVKRMKATAETEKQKNMEEVR